MTGNQFGVPFEKEEYQARLNNVRKKMEEKSMELLMVRDPANIHYLTGYNTLGLSNFVLLLVSINCEPILFARQLECFLAYKTTNLHEIYPWQDHENPFLILKDILSQRQISTQHVGIEKTCRYFTVADYTRLSRILNDNTLDGSGIVESCRMIKSPSEIEYIRQAGVFSAIGMRAGMDAVKEGATENEVAGAVYNAMVSSGSEMPSGGPIVTGGWKSGIPHSNFFRLMLQQGDAILFEHGGVYNRYCAPLMRTAVIGPKFNPEIKKMYEVCKEALQAAINIIRPGVTSAEVDAACSQVIEQAGYYEYYKKRAGYSVGVGFQPSWMEAHIFDLKKGDTRELKAGMVFHIPPALRKYGEFGVGISETVAVTDSGCEVLTNYSNELNIK